MDSYAEGVSVLHKVKTLQRTGDVMIDAWWLIIDYSQKNGELFGEFENNTYLCGVKLMMEDNGDKWR